MSAMPLTYELPEQLSCAQLIIQLSAQFPVVVMAQENAIKTFYDSFDWRLYKAGMSLEYVLSKPSGIGSLSLKNIKYPQTLMAIELSKVPKFAKDFSSPDFRKQLALVLEMRALLPVSELHFQHTLINILNTDQKTILRLGVDCYDTLPGRVNVQIIKGYDKKVLAMLAILQADFALKPIKQNLLHEALSAQNITPGTYSSKFAIELDPEMRTDIASKYIYSHLLNRMQLTLDGCIQNIDSEFLHDFRVAVRRTRAGLSQFKDVLPKDQSARFVEFFSWLGQITGSVRDIDVYLLNFDNYKRSLPIIIRENLEPFYDFLVFKQQDAYAQLAKQLTSERYSTNISEWQEFLKMPVIRNPTESFATMPIKAYADQRIWKVYKRLLKNAAAINDQSPGEALHSLRKTGKKLRYLMEFFQSLYPQSSMKILLKLLKSIQEVLGDFQDYEVQNLALKKFSQEMHTTDVPVATYLAMGVLIQQLDQRKTQARSRFSEAFTEFSRKQNQSTFKALFAPKKKTK